jgi:hypothetical protein
MRPKLPIRSLWSAAGQKNLAVSQNRSFVTTVADRKCIAFKKANKILALGSVAAPSTSSPRSRL